MIELLCVIAIIGILAALLLPAINNARTRATRMTCVSHLQQMGLAFHGFAHDHNGKFPMELPASGGGTLQFVQAANQLDGEFYFAFRHFQALSNELVTPKMLVCPADDQRVPASDFAMLKNENISYFVGAKADLMFPQSILAGDRNITNDWLGSRSSLQLGPNQFLRWTHELHRFKGNILFADGHIERQNNLSLASPPGDSRVADLYIPSTRSTTPTPVNSPVNPGGRADGGRPANPNSLPVAGQQGAPRAPTAQTGLAHAPTAAPAPVSTSSRNALQLSTAGEVLSQNQKQSKDTNKVVPPPPEKQVETPPAVATNAAAWPTSVLLQMSGGRHWPFHLLWRLLIVALLAMEIRRRLRASQKKKNAAMWSHAGRS